MENVTGLHENISQFFMGFCYLQMQKSMGDPGISHQGDYRWD